MKVVPRNENIYDNIIVCLRYEGGTTVKYVMMGLKGFVMANHIADYTHR